MALGSGSGATATTEPGSRDPGKASTVIRARCPGTTRSTFSSGTLTLTCSGAFRSRTLAIFSRWRTAAPSSIWGRPSIPLRAGLLA